MDAKRTFKEKIKEKMKKVRKMKVHVIFFTIYFKTMPGKASALNPVSEDERGRKVWDRGEFSRMAEDRLKK